MLFVWSFWQWRQIHCCFYNGMPLMLLQWQSPLRHCSFGVTLVEWQFLSSLFTASTIAWLLCFSSGSCHSVIVLFVDCFVEWPQTVATSAPFQLFFDGAIDLVKFLLQEKNQDRLILFQGLRVTGFQGNWQYVQNTAEYFSCNFFISNNVSRRRRLFHWPRG